MGIDELYGCKSRQVYIIISYLTSRRDLNRNKILDIMKSFESNYFNDIKGEYIVSQDDTWKYVMEKYPTALETRKINDFQSLLFEAERYASEYDL